MNGFELLALAAKGDVDAQSRMVDELVGTDPENSPPAEAVSRDAEWWARLAAAHGRQCDTLRLAGVLMLRAGLVGNERASMQYQVEAFAHLNGLADDGCEEADRLLMQFGGVVSPEVLAMADSVCAQTLKSEND